MIYLETEFFREPHIPLRLEEICNIENIERHNIFNIYSPKLAHINGNENMIDLILRYSKLGLLEDKRAIYYEHRISRNKSAKQFSDKNAKPDNSNVKNNTPQKEENTSSKFKNYNANDKHNDNEGVVIMAMSIIVRVMTIEITTKAGQSGRIIQASQKYHL